MKEAKQIGISYYDVNDKPVYDIPDGLKDEDTVFVDNPGGNTYMMTFSKFKKHFLNNEPMDKIPEPESFKNGDIISVKTNDNKVITGKFDGNWDEEDDEGIFIDNQPISRKNIKNISKTEDQINEVLHLAGVK